MIAAARHFIYRGGGRRAVPDDVTHVSIHESITSIPLQAFHCHPNMVELICHPGVYFIENRAFCMCSSLKRIVIPGVRFIDFSAFLGCKDLTDVEGDMLERIGENAFGYCSSLRNINLLSIKFVGTHAFSECEQLRDAIFSSNLESIKGVAFCGCSSLQRITLPLKIGLINLHHDRNHFDLFYLCTNLKHVDLVEGEVLNKTAAALLMEEWQDDMNIKIDSIAQILPNTFSGTRTLGVRGVDGKKGEVIQEWMTSVLRKVIYYKAEHNRSLKVAAAAFQPFVPNDIVTKNIIPFLELPSHKFQEEDEVAEE